MATEVPRARGLLVAALLSTAACGVDVQVQVVPVGGTTRHRLVVGYASACVVLDDGGVACWGAGQRGELGVPMRSDSGTPVRVRGLARIVTLDGYGAAFCAADAEGRVWCWGRMWSGGPALGDTPRRVDGLDASRTLTVGDTRVCGVSRAGIHCVFARTPLDASLREGSNLIDYDDEARCALTDGGDVICVTGPSGNPTTTTVASAASALDGWCSVDALGTRTCSRSTTPSETLTDVASVGTGSAYEHCYVLFDGRILCRAGLEWIPKRSDHRFVEVGGTLQQGCARTDDGAVLCWGDNLSGLLGPDAGPHSDVPVRIPGLALGGTPEVVEAPPSGLACFAADRDGDGLFDWIEGTDDLDEDGLLAWEDSDTDGDGTTDAVEAAPSLPPCLTSPPNSICDSDAWPDYADLDQDDDGVLDRDESIDARCTDDADRDGCPDVAIAQFGTCDDHHGATIVDDPAGAFARASLTLTVPVGPDPGEVFLVDLETDTLGQRFVFSATAVISGVATPSGDRFVDTQSGAQLRFGVEASAGYGARSGASGIPGIETHRLQLVDTTGTVLDEATMITVIAAIPSWGP